MAAPAKAHTQPLKHARRRLRLNRWRRGTVIARSVDGAMTFCVVAGLHGFIGHRVRFCSAFE
jgi:hypothetical protein